MQQLLEEMTLEQKVGQLFLVRPDSLDLSQTQDQINDAKADGVTELTDAMRQTLAEYPVGGVVIFGKNLESPQQITQFLDDLQQASDTPLFTAIDEEGGLVARLANNAAFDLPQYESAAAVGTSGNPEDARAVGTVTLNKTLDDLRSCELVPFAQNVNNAPLIMAAHITVPQVTEDDTPASLSSVMLMDLLRGELGYQGLIVTDSLAMQAITDVYTPGQAAVKALQAGADLLLMPNGLADAYTAVLEAVQDGTIPQQRLDESVQRILQCKYQYGILTQ